MLCWLLACVLQGSGCLLTSHILPGHQPTSWLSVADCVMFGLSCQAQLLQLACPSFLLESSTSS